jgi:hypothetical protein
VNKFKCSDYFAAEICIKKVKIFDYHSSFEFYLRLISHATYFFGKIETMSTKLPPNKFFTFKYGSLEGNSHELTLAIFTYPDTSEGEVADDENSYCVLLDTEPNGVISIKIDEFRFKFTPKQAVALASILTQLSREKG